MPYEMRFWAGVEKTRYCWLWRKSATANGYGQFDNQRAHRVAWKLTMGSIPKGLLVLHKCDVKLCVRPSHLFIGTQQDNINDMFSKGRARKAKGENHGNAKLQEKDALKIKDANGLHADIAIRFGVSRPTVSMIKNGTRWAHLTK